MTFFTFVESRCDAFLNPKTFNKPAASNNIRILIAAVFHFVAAVDEHIDLTLKCYKIFPVVRRKKEPAWTTTNAAIYESLCDTFLDEKPNKQFSVEKQKDKAVVFHFVASVQEQDNFKT